MNSNISIRQGLGAINKCTSTCVYVPVPTYHASYIAYRRDGAMREQITQQKLQTYFGPILELDVEMRGL